ncbi:hypothetical protein KC345_g7551, partial [Hortaea werneckii]
MVLRGIDLEVYRGQIIGYIGPNGAGKSTTVKIMLGLVEGYSGTVRIFGRDIADGDTDYKRRIGYVPEVAELYDSLTAREYLTFIGELYGMKQADADAKAGRLMGLLNLSKAYDMRIASYSKGMKQKVLLISSMLHDPDILFLDEPLSGLDANSVMVVKEIFATLAARGKTIFYSSHIMDVVEKISSRIILLDGGDIVADGSFAELREQSREGISPVSSCPLSEKVPRMNDFLVLKLLDRVQGIFKKLGVDYAVLRRILQVKLTMDGRRTPTIFSGPQEPRQNTEGSPFRVQWFYLLLGLMLIAMVAPEGNSILMMGLLFSIVMFMITTTLISDFSSVLLDLRDKNILFSKPVDHRTLNMAKNIHILIYLLTLTFTFTGPSLLFSLYRHGVAFFLLYAAEIILMDGFILVFTALTYLLILRFFDSEKVKDLINYVQIILSIGVAVGAQLISHLFDITELGLTFAPAWWQFLIAPVWFAAPFELLNAGPGNGHLTALAILAFVVPIVLFVAYVKLMPAFERSLQKLAEQGAAGQDSGRLSRRLSEITCRNKEEAMFFRFTWSMMKNEREFKLRVYPSVGLSLALPFIFMFNQVWTGDPAALRNSKAYLFIYFSALMMMTVVQMLRYSASYKGAWIYKVIPLPRTSM